MLDFFLPDKYYEGVGKTLDTSGGKGGVSLETVFEKVGGLLNEELVSKTKGLFLFQIKEGGEFFIDMKSGAGSVGKGAPSDKADVTFITNEESMLSMFTGKLKPTAAFMTGKLKIKGDMGKAMKLEKLMSQMKGKL